MRNPAASNPSVFLVQRGNCSFVEKYSAVLTAGGSGMLLYDDLPGCITMGGSLANSSNASSSQPQPRNASQPPAVSLDHADGLAMLQLLQEVAAAAAGAAPAGAGVSGGAASAGGGVVLLQYQLLDVPALDASALLLWLMAVGTVVAGSLWSGWDYAQELRGFAAGLEDGRPPGGQSNNVNNKQPPGMEVLEISSAGAVGFVLVSSGMLVVLYFFLNQAFFYVILGGFCLAGAQALGVLLVPLLRCLLPARLACCQVRMPCAGWGSLPLVDVLVAPLSFAVAVVWAVFRNSAWSWVLQDLLGIAVMLLVLRLLRLPNLKVACVLLPLCFAYDVWWVFLQPMLFGDGTSVMVEVAGGGNSHEFLPMLLRVPRLSGPPILKGAYSLLGFGDVILPGLLVALMRRLDVAGQSGPAYFVASVMGYGAGLLLTYVALMFSWFGDQGQPALLYLVPTTLGVVLVLAAVRGELRALMHADGGAAGDSSDDDDDGAGFCCDSQQQQQQRVRLQDGDDDDDDTEQSEGEEDEEAESSKGVQQQQQQQRLGSGPATASTAAAGGNTGGRDGPRGSAALLLNNGGGRVANTAAGGGGGRGRKKARGGRKTAEQQGLLSGRRN